MEGKKRDRKEKKYSGGERVKGYIRGRMRGETLVLNSMRLSGFS